MTNQQHSTTPHAVGGMIRSILHEQVQCVMATQSEGALFQHLMAYAFEEGLSTVYFASLATTRKVTNIRVDPQISLLWDNRTGNNKDHVSGFALTAMGYAQTLDNDQLCSHGPHPAKRLRQRNASLSGLLDQDDAVILAVSIQRYHLVKGYTESYEYIPTDG